MSSGGSCVVDQQQQQLQQQQSNEHSPSAMGMDFNVPSPNSSNENSHSSTSDLDAPGPSSYSGHGSDDVQPSTAQLTYFPQSASAATAALPWNIQKGLNCRRPRLEENRQQMHDANAAMDDETETGLTNTNFAYPQLLSSTRHHRSDNKVRSEPANKSPRYMSSSSPQQQKHTTNVQQQQQANLHEDPSSSMTYLRPMPPLIPVTAATIQIPRHHALGSDHQSVPPLLEPLTISSRGPPRKSSRFRDSGSSGRAGGCDGSGSESSDHSPISSASSSPPLFEQNHNLSTSAAADQGLRSTSVIQFAHRPSSNNSSPSSNHE